VGGRRARRADWATAGPPPLATAPGFSCAVEGRVEVGGGLEKVFERVIIAGKLFWGVGGTRMIARWRRVGFCFEGERERRELFRRTPVIPVDRRDE
jgi:hypothetical protein